jgi:hypothetical protein
MRLEGSASFGGSVGRSASAICARASGTCGFAWLVVVPLFNWRIIWRGDIGGTIDDLEADTAQTTAFRCTGDAGTADDGLSAGSASSRASCRRYRHERHGGRHRERHLDRRGRGTCSQCMNESIESSSPSNDVPPSPATAKSSTSAAPGGEASNSCLVSVPPPTTGDAKGAPFLTCEYPACERCITARPEQRAAHRVGKEYEHMLSLRRRVHDLEGKSEIL